MKNLIVCFAPYYTDTRTPWNRFETADYEFYTKLNQLQVVYDGKEFPLKRFEFTGDSTNDGFLRLYKENMHNLGMTAEYAETYEDFIKRGLYIAIPVNDNTEKPKTVKIRWRFDPVLNAAVRIYVFTEHSYINAIDIKNGIVQQVKVIGV